MLLEPHPVPSMFLKLLRRGLLLFVFFSSLSFKSSALLFRRRNIVESALYGKKKWAQYGVLTMRGRFIM
jgi:hypothetical protein